MALMFQIFFQLDYGHKCSHLETLGQLRAILQEIPIPSLTKNQGEQLLPPIIMTKINQFGRLLTLKKSSSRIKREIVTYHQGVKLSLLIYRAYYSRVL